MTRTTRTVVVAAVLALAVCAGAALGSPATTTTTDERTNETATVTFSDQEFDGESVTIDSATLPDGGFAVVYDQNSERVGHSEYLDAGEHEDVTVSLDSSADSQVFVATLYRANGTEDYDASEVTEEYETEDGAAVSDVAFVTSESEDDGAEETSSESETTEAAMSDDEADESGEESDEEASGGVPGFTTITAVVALLAAALVAVRKH